MTELAQIIKMLSLQSYRYNTFRGHWGDMPDSTGLCVSLGILSFMVNLTTIYVEYGLQMAIGMPIAWLAAIWLYASDGGWFNLNKRLMSAVFLLTIPAMIILAFIGHSVPVAEMIAGAYLSACILSLKTRE